MDCNEYQKEALKLAKESTRKDRLLEGVMGLTGEAGECVDIVKKHLFQGHDLDREHLALELGDVAWYLSEMAHSIGYNFNDILQMNLEKINKRYPNGFSEKASINRHPNDI